MTEVATVDLDKPLSQRELARYNELKETIVSTIAASYYTVGKAIDELQRDLLYRGEYLTIEACCKDLFDLGRSRLYQLVDSAKIYDQLSTNGGQSDPDSDIVIDVLPTNERQIRPLLKVPEPKRPEVWAMAVNASTKRQPSGGTVAKVVKAYLGEETETKIKNTHAKVAVSRQLGSDMKAALDTVLDEVRRAKGEGYKTSSRLSIVQALDAIRRLVSEDGDPIAENRIERSNREKLLAAGFVFLRPNHQQLIIEQLSREHYDWIAASKPYPTAEAMGLAFETMITASKHLRD